MAGIVPQVLGVLSAAGVTAARRCPLNSRHAAGHPLVFRMPETLPLTTLDAALRGMLVALLATVAAVLVRDRPRHPAARAGVAMCLGLCVQAFASTPWIETSWPGPWQAPLVAVSVANVVLFWVFVQALFDDAFVFRPVHGLAWLAVAALSGCNCALGPNYEFASVTFGLQRAVPLLFAVLAAVGRGVSVAC